jgi:hypothetical protein
VVGWWWNNGHKKWSRQAEAFIGELGYKRQTLKVYGSVCNAVKPLMRINDLSFNHHQLVAPRDPPEQREWLKKARNHRIFDLWMACHTQQVIAEAVGITQQTLSTDKAFTAIGNLANLSKADRAASEHAVDFDVPNRMGALLVELLTRSALLPGWHGGQCRSTCIPLPSSGRNTPRASRTA